MGQVQQRSAEFYVKDATPGLTPTTSFAALPGTTPVSFTLSTARRVNVACNIVANGNAIGPAPPTCTIVTTQLYVDGTLIPRSYDYCELMTGLDGFGNDLPTCQLRSQTYVDLPAGAHTATCQYTMSGCGQSSGENELGLIVAHFSAEWAAFSWDSGEVGTTAPLSGSLVPMNF